MSDFAIAPVMPDIGVWYYPPVGGVVSFAPFVRGIRGSTWRSAPFDRVTLSERALDYLYITGSSDIAYARAISQPESYFDRDDLGNPGPDLSQAATQLGSGPVVAFVPGDYSGAILVGQDLQNAVFDTANMQDANFFSANLQESTFINSQVQGAQFAQANLRGANLSGALGLQPNQLYGAIFDDSTILPADVARSIYGTSSDAANSNYTN